MSILYMLGEFFWCLVGVLFFWFYLENIGTRKEKCTWQMLVVNLIFNIALTWNGCVTNNTLQYIIILLFFGVINSFFYVGRLYWRIFWIISYIAVKLLCELLASTILVTRFPEEQQTDDFFIIMQNIISKMLIVIYIYTVTLLRKKNTNLPSRELAFAVWALIVGNICITVGVLSFFEYRFYKHLVIGLEAIVVGLFVGTIVTYWLFSIITKIYEELKEKQEMKCEYEKKELYFREIEKQQEEIRKIKHDIKNQMLGLYSYLQCGTKCANKNEALAVVEEIQEQLETVSSYGYTKCFPIENILKEKLSYAKELRIRCECEVHMNGELQMKYGDIGIMLGNLLDNATEAAKEHKEAYMGVRIRQKKEHLMIEIKNTTATDFFMETSKLDKKNHGFGLRSVKQIVEKYNGQFKIEQIEEMVIVRIMLFQIIKMKKDLE